MRTNWLQKLSQTGYMDTQLFGEFGSYEKWDDIEKRRNSKKQAAQEDASKRATENGHVLKTWTDIDTAECKKCGREVRLHNLYGRAKTLINGRAIDYKCDSDIYNTFNDNPWEYRMRIE